MINSITFFPNLQPIVLQNNDPISITATILSFSVIIIPFTIYFINNHMRRKLLSKYCQELDISDLNIKKSWRDISITGKYKGHPFELKEWIGMHWAIHYFVHLECNNPQKGYLKVATQPKINRHKKYFNHKLDKRFMITSKPKRFGKQILEYPGIAELLVKTQSNFWKIFGTFVFSDEVLKIQKDGKMIIGSKETLLTRNRLENIFQLFFLLSNILENEIQTA